jgi:hypothetical protein
MGWENRKEFPDTIPAGYFPVGGLPTCLPHINLPGVYIRKNTGIFFLFHQMRKRMPNDTPEGRRSKKEKSDQILLKIIRKTTALFTRLSHREISPDPCPYDTVNNSVGLVPEKSWHNSRYNSVCRWNIARYPLTRYTGRYSAAPGPSAAVMCRSGLSYLQDSVAHPAAGSP